MASIKKRPDGRWRARYRDPSGKEHAKHFARRIDGQQWLDRQAAALVSDQWVDPKAGRITFAGYFREWAGRQVWVPGTVRSMDLVVRTVPFADTGLSRIRRSHVEAWVKSMDTAGLAAGTVRMRVNNARAVFRAAVRDRVIVRDPTEGVRLPRDRRGTSAVTGLPTGEQVAAVLGATDGRLVALVALCAFAGLRLGEAAAVQVGDIDFLRRTLDVRRQVQRAGGMAVEIRAPKYGSERTVYLPEQLVQLLARHVERHCPGDDATRWMFHGGDPTLPPHQNTVGCAWRAACKRAEVSGVTLHDTRHFYASGLIAAGCDVVTVQRALGHAKATTTLGTYAHLWPTAEDRTRQAAGELMAAALPTLADRVRTSDGL
jgi:integrase